MRARIEDNGERLWTLACFARDACCPIRGQCCKFQMQTSLLSSVCRAFLGCQTEEAVYEPNLSKKIISCHPSNLPLPDHVDCFVALNCSPSRLEFSEALLRIHATFDGAMILFENVVQVLHRSVSTAVAQRPFLFTVGDRGAVYRRQISVDHSRLGMGSNRR